MTTDEVMATVKERAADIRGAAGEAGGREAHQGARETSADHELVRRLYESVPLLMGVVETTEDDILHLSDNAAARRFFGQESTAGRWASEMGVGAAARREWLRWYARAQSTGVPARFDFRHPTGFFSVYVSFVGMAATGRPSFSYVAEDVSRRVLAEDELARQLTLTRTIAETAVDAIILADDHGRATYVNPAAVRLFGYTEDELLGQPVHERLHPRYPDGRPYPIDACPLAEVRHGVVLRDHEDVFFRKDGTPVRVSCSTAPLARDGQFEAAVLVLHDISERYRTAGALRSAEDRLRRAVEAAQLGTWEYDFATGRATRSQGFEDLFGMRAEDLPSTEEFWTRIHPEDVDGLRGAYDRAIAECGFYARDFRVRVGGQVRWLRAQGQAQAGPDGIAAGTAGAVMDVTEQREAVNALAGLATTLEQRVGERTAELAAANEELRAFSWSVSHDLRAPLRAVDAYAGLLVADHAAELGEGGRAYLARIRAAVKRMAQLIDALLDLSRIGRQELRLEVVDLGEIAHEVLGELARAEPQRRVEVDVGRGLQVVGDSRLLRTVMENLLGNAWKYTRRRQDAHVTVGREGAAVFVRDDGAGFDMAHAAMLFEPFHRLHGPGEFEGNGVGLATVARIVRRHGGRIWAEAAPDRGATFWFTLEG